MCDDILTAKQAAEYLGIKYKTFYCYVGLGIIPGFKMENKNGVKRWRFDKNQLHKWDETRKKNSIIRNLMNMDMVAEYTNLSRTTVLLATTRGNLKSHRLGKVWVYIVKDVNKWLQSRNKEKSIRKKIGHKHN